jgi:predicted DNA-binding transcriptional regulator YafY
MPLNKNATIRYQALDKCFSDFRHRYYIDDLIDACAEALIEYTGHDSVSRRTVFEDITFMESEQGWSIPLERHKDGKKVYYRYKYKDFSINNQELTADEISQLKTTILTISRYRGLPSTEWLEDVISNLEYRFGLKSHSDNVLSFEQNVGLKGIEHLSTLIDAASNKQTLSIRYKNFEGKEELWTIYPYYLKQYNNRWFLFGWNEKYDSLSNMALDRIEEIKLTDFPFRENKDIDFNTYFDDIVGVTVPNAEIERQTIRLRFDRKRFPYVVSKPLHKSQIVKNKDQYEIEIHVRPTRELDQQILSFIPDIEVIYPEWYRQQILGKITENLNKYTSGKIDCTDNV